MPSPPIQSPSAYSVSRAVAFADVDGSAMLVSATTPLPVTAMASSGSPTPLAGTASASGVQGPFLPAIGRPVMLSLQGSWSGTAQVLRSTDNGTTKLPLTIAGSAWGVFTSNCCEPIWEESEAVARLYLDIALASGNVTYRLAQ
jgi:hypothetical protein